MTGRTSAVFRHAVEKINEAALQRIFGADDQEAVFLGQLLEDLRSMSQMVCGGANVGPNSVPHQRIRVVPEVGFEQRFHGWPNAANDRTETPRLIIRRLLQFFQSCQDSPALGMPENDHQLRTESRARRTRRCRPEKKRRCSRQHG